MGQVMWRSLAILGLAFVRTLGLSAADQVPVDNGLAQQLQAVLETSFSQYDVRGCSAAIVLPNGSAWCGVTGISHEGVSVESDMLFGIGSITKNYTVPLILALAEEEYLGLDDTLADWGETEGNLPDEISMLQLLNQRSGLCNVTDQGALWDTVLADASRIWTPEEVLDTYLQTPCYLPDVTWHYSNTSYLLAGLLVESAAARSFAELLNEWILNPLGLEHTRLLPDEDVGSSLPVCHGWFDLNEDGTDEDMTEFRDAISSVLWAAGGMYASAGDVARWIDMLFSEQFISPSSIAQMTTPYSVIPNTGGMAHGLGLNLYGNEAFVHSGRVFGYVSALAYLPQESATIVVLTNGDDAACVDAVSSALTLVVLDYLAKPEQ